MNKLFFRILATTIVSAGLAGCFGFGRGHGPVDAFQFLTSRNPSLSQNITGVMNEQADPVEILMVVPPDTGSFNLVATFSLNAQATITVVSTGRLVPQQNGVTRNDFSAPVLYSVLVAGEKKPWRYRVTVRFAETNAALSQINIPEGYAMTPLFSPKVKSYSVDVPYSVKQVKVEAKGQSQNMKNIAIDGAGSGGASASATVDFSSGASRRVSIETLAEDGATRDEYVVTLERLPADSNAKLASLELVDTTLVPVFSPLRTSYQAEVPYDATQVVVKAATQSTYATITLQTLAVAGRLTSGRTALASRGSPNDRAGAVIDFRGGTALFLIVAVIAEDGGLQEYLVEVRRAEPDHNNSLAELAVAGSRMSPAFAPKVFRYAVEVPYSTRQLVVTARAQSPHATMELMLGPAAAGTAVPQLQARGDLDRGSVTVEFPTAERIVLAVAVTAQDGRTQQYALDVRRAPPDSNADLGALTVSAGVLSPIFSPRVISYAVSLPASVESVRITATAASDVATVEVEGVAVRPAAAQSFTVSVSGGATTTINLIVTAEDGTQKLYRVRVSREATGPGGGTGDANTRLARLQLVGAQLNPSFDPRVREYEARLPSNVASVTLTAVAESPAATIAVDGQPLSRTGRVIALDPGALKTVVIAVTAENGTVAQTILWLSREASGSGRDTNTRLARLQLMGAELSPSFDPRITEYRAEMAANVPSVTLIAAVESARATIEVDGQPLSRTGRVISLDPGASRTVVVDVRAEAGNVARTLIRLSREAGGTPPVEPPGGGDRISVILDKVKVARRELASLSAGAASIGSEARITVRSYRTTRTLAQGSANLAVKMEGSTPVISARWTTTAVKLDPDRLVEVEVAIPAGGSAWLYYTEAQWASTGIDVDVPFLLLARDLRVAWPALGRNVSVTGFITIPKGGPGRQGPLGEAEALELNAKGEYGIEVTITDPSSGKVLGRDTVWNRPGLPLGRVLTFSRPMSLPEGATVKYTLTAAARSGREWSAAGTTQVWTTKLAYDGGFEPVVLQFSEILAPPR